ncbi:flavodoxin family protein [Slackia heliotrinireducens]|uniref:flavodoxin family protein n=1 Tax=Slackia heliotrinireducens TaxID=84110 RepID=UPI0033147166
MKIMVLNGSARRNGNTAAMVSAFKRGAETAGHEVIVFDVANMTIAGCRGCEYCHTKGNGSCIQKDDMQAIYDEWNEMDMLVLASPIYYGSHTGQLSCAIHRTYALDIPKRCRKSAMILSSGAPDVYDASRSIYNGFIHGYFRTQDMGVFTAVGAEAKSPAMQEKLEVFGRSL